MATLNVRDEIYDRLASNARAAHITVDALVEPALEQLAALPPDETEAAERQQAFEAWQKAVNRRRDRYPQGHQVDDSRESIYGGAEERGT